MSTFANKSAAARTPSNRAFRLAAVAIGLALESHDAIRKIVQSLPTHRGKDIVMINLAQGGYKEPQQLLALGYVIALGQPLDLVINMDGFNEAYISWENVHDHGAD